MKPFCTAFAGTRRIAAGPLAEVALRIKALLEHEPDAAVLVFDNADSRVIDLDLRGSADEIVARLPAAPAAVVETGASNDAPARGPGRPRLGVVAREVTLLPRHWDWLAGQPGGASVALRKLVDEARRANDGRDQGRRAQEAAYRFMSAMSGDQPQFEEAARALFAGDGAALQRLLAGWPLDVRNHALDLAQPALAG